MEAEGEREWLEGGPERDWLDGWHTEIGDYCEPRYPAEPCPNCGARNNGELHLPEYTLLCYVCETRFPVTNPLAETQ